MLPDNVTGKVVICFKMNTKIGMKFSLMLHIFHQITPLIQFIQDIIIWDCIKSNQEIITCIIGMVLEFHILIHIQTVCFIRKGVEVALVSSLRINIWTFLMVDLCQDINIFFFDLIGSPIHRTFPSRNHSVKTLVN